MRTHIPAPAIVWMSLAAAMLVWPADTLAQRGRGGSGGQGAAPRTGGGAPGSGYAVPRHPGQPGHGYPSRPYYGHYRPYGYPYYPYYRPYYPYYGFYGSFYWGWGGFGWYPFAPYYYWGAPYYAGYPYAYGYGGYPGPWYGDAGALRVEVKPREGQVYIDGEFAGLVDDFDGISQRLYAKPGEHQVEIYLNGYQTAREKVLFRPGVTLKLKAVLQPLAPGEAQPPRPQPASPPADSVPGSGTRGYSRQAPPDAISIDPAPAQPDDGTAERSVFGTLSIRVQPRDAVVFVDGERWEGGEGGTRLVIELAEGTHRVEVQKPGYTTYTTEIRVRRGRVTTLNVSLLTAGEV